MIILTISSDGEISGAFAKQTSMKSCENKLSAIIQIIKSAGSNTVEFGCFSGNWSFSQFSHNEKKHEEKDSRKFYYFVDFKMPEKPIISPMIDAKACAVARETEALKLDSEMQKKLYCVSSLQNWQVIK